MGVRVLEDIRPVWAAPIVSELDMVEGILESEIDSEVSVAFDLSMHLFSAGGKRIRPALVLLSAMAANENVDIEKVGSLAAATELVHMASLVHDDVVDETRERRGERTANSLWGNKMSVLGGDYLLSKAFSLLATNGDNEIFTTLSSMAVGMTESEMLQAQSEGSISAWHENYDKIINGKTASFMRACCECGAMLGGADFTVSNALGEYGMQLGKAFQITDDVLDIAGDPAQTGKDIGADLVSGKYTLPVLLALQKPAFQLNYPTQVLEGFLTSKDAAQIAGKIIECGAIDDAQELAQDCVLKACNSIIVLPASRYSSALESLAQFVIGRTA